MSGLLLSAANGIAASNWAFLNIAHGSREIAMGETGVSHSRNGQGMLWNPAHLSHGESDAWFDVFRLIADTKGSSGGAHLKSNWGGLGVYYLNHETGGFEIRDRPGPALGEFALHQSVLGAGIAANLMDNLSVGTSFKWAMEDIYGDRFRATLADIGVYWRNDFIATGLTVANVGIGNPSSDDFPVTLRTGISREFAYKDFDALFSAELVTIRHSTPYIHSGFEIDWMRQIFIRAGYVYGHDSRSLSYGIGVNKGKFRIDIAISPSGNDLGTTWHFGIGMKI